MDARLYRLDDNLGPIFVASAFSVTDDETLYLRRADADATYLIEIFGFRTAAQLTYSMGVNIFNDCVDDEAFRLEHNDTPAQAISLPEGREVAQVCDYDDDYYTFTLTEAQQVRLDLIFDDSDGDLDMTLQGDTLNSSVQARSITDNETIDAMLEAGTYTVRIYSYQDNQNSYRLFKTSGILSTTVVDLSGDGRAIPDYANGDAGILDVDIPVSAPPGSLIRMLSIRSMDINHNFLKDLYIVARWNGVDVAVLWNRLGGSNGNDGGFDDDLTDILGGRDIVFDDRDYPEFAGLPADGIFTLHIEDQAIGDTGSIDDLVLEVEYLVP